jgi:recombination protein RecT
MTQETQKEEETIKGYLCGGQNTANFRDALHKLTGNLIDADQLLASAWKEYKSTPKFAACTVVSFLSAIKTCAQLQLYPGPLGHVYLLPYLNKKTNITSCNFMLGYKGQNQLAYRNGIWLRSQEIFEDEMKTFVYVNGNEPRFHHEPRSLLLPDKELGKLVGVYSEARFNDVYYPYVMRLSEVNAHKARSQTSTFGPWVTDFNAMAKKTVSRKHFNYLPVTSQQLATALAVDDSVIIDGELNEQIEGGPKQIALRESLESVNTVNELLKAKLNKEDVPNE